MYEGSSQCVHFCQKSEILKNAFERSCTDSSVLFGIMAFLALLIHQVWFNVLYSQHIHASQSFELLICTLLYEHHLSETAFFKISLL